MNARKRYGIQSDFKIVADYFVQARKNMNYQPPSQIIRHVHEVLELMSVVTKDDRFEEVGNQLKGGDTTMCEVLDRIEARGEAKGIEKGKAEGKVEGKAEDLRNLMDTMGFSLAQAMKALKIRQSDYARYEKLLKNL